MEKIPYAREILALALALVTLAIYISEFGAAASFGEPVEVAP